MYASFFGLKQEPFSIAPDPRYLYMSERHREALAHLLYGVQGAGGGFVLLTGEIGAGKTTVCRCLLEQIPKRSNVAYIFNPKLTVLELLKTVCEEFHVPYAHDGPGQPTVKDYLDPLNGFLLKTHAIGQNNVLIIDEAQNLSSDVLEQLRLLTNLETNQRKLLQIVLIGQPELRTMLARPELEQLAQRVIARYHLDALSDGETAKYLQHRLGVAGLATANPFTRRAMQRIHLRSRGVPRRINLLADRALLGAYADGVARVDHRIVERAATEVFGPSERLRGLGRLAPWALGAALGAVLASGAGFWLQRDPSAAAAAAPAQAAATGPSASAAAAASAATTQASAAADTAPPIAPLFITATELTTRFLNPLRREADAWRELAPLWPAGGPDASATDPCASSPASTWQCFKSSNGGLALIRQLDRPGWLTLRDDRGQPVYALLVGLDERSATLRLGPHRVAVALVSMANLWPGDFATYWRAPAGYRHVVGDGDSGALVDQLAAQLASLRGEPAPTGAQRYDAAMKSRVQAFQLAHGIQADGLAGPATFMQLARAFDTPGAVTEPRLAGSH